MAAELHECYMMIFHSLKQHETKRLVRFSPVKPRIGRPWKCFTGPALNNGLPTLPRCLSIFSQRPCLWLRPFLLADRGRHSPCHFFGGIEPLRIGCCNPFFANCTSNSFSLVLFHTWQYFDKAFHKSWNRVSIFLFYFRLPSIATNNGPLSSSFRCRIFCWPSNVRSKNCNEPLPTEGVIVDFIGTLKRAPITRYLHVCFWRWKENAGHVSIDHLPQWQILRKY